VFRASLATTVDAYAAAGAHVTVIEQVPSQQYDARSIYRMAAKAADPPGLLRTRSVPEERYLRYQAFVASVFRQYAGDPRIDFISLRPALCRDGVCTVGTVHASYYFDDNHLTIAGAEAVSADLEASLFRNHFAR
jgi:SGNH domain-containing protein